MQLKAIKNDTGSSNANLNVFKKLKSLIALGPDLNKKCFIKIKSKIKRLIIESFSVCIQM